MDPRGPGLTGLGDFDDGYEQPASFYNVGRDVLYAGATPSDFYRATEIRNMASPYSPMRYSSLLEDWDSYARDDDLGDYEWDPQLGGFFKKIWKETKRGAKRATKEGTRQFSHERLRKLQKTLRRVEDEVERGVKKYGPEAIGIIGTLVGGPAVGAVLFAATNKIRGDYLQSKAEKAARDRAYEYEQSLVDEDVPEIADEIMPIDPGEDYPLEPLPVATTVPASVIPAPSIPSSPMSTLPGPTFVGAAGGFALPAGVPDQVAVEDQGPGGWISDAEWDAPLPGAGAGSWIPTPPLDEFPNAPAFDPFDVPAEDVDGGEPYPGFGMGYGTGPWESVESRLDASATFGLGDADAMQNTSEEIGFGTLGAESWWSTLATSVGETVIAYQQARLQAKAARKGYKPLEFGTPTFTGKPIPAAVPAPPAIPPPPPVAAAPAQPFAPPPRIITIPAAAPAAAAPPAGFGGLSPQMMMGLGLLAILALQRR